MGSRGRRRERWTRARVRVEETDKDSEGRRDSELVREREMESGEEKRWKK